jgi:hypothetical protein
VVERGGWTYGVESFDCVDCAEKFRVFVVGGIEAYADTFDEKFAFAGGIASFDVFDGLCCVGIDPECFMGHL